MVKPALLLDAIFPAGEPPPVKVTVDASRACVLFGEPMRGVRVYADADALVAALRTAADQLEAAARPADRSAQARRDGCCGNPIPGSDAVCDRPSQHFGGCGLVGATAVYGGAA